MVICSAAFSDTAEVSARDMVNEVHLWLQIHSVLPHRNKFYRYGSYC